MKEIRRCFCSFSFYDQQAIQEKLEDMAERGWMLEKPGGALWTYRRMEPKKLRFCVTYFPGASDFDPGPTEGELIKIDYCRQDGWELVTRWGVMQIFCTEKLDAVPIETEPAAQVENLRRSMRKSVLLPQAILCVTFLLNIVLRVSLLWIRDPVDALSDPLELYSVAMFGALMLAGLYEIWFYFHWGRKARMAAQNDGVFLPIKSRPVASWVLLAFSTLFLLLVCRRLSGGGGFILSYLCALLLMIVIVNLIKKYLKKRGVSRNVNRAISFGSIFLLTFLLLGGMTASIIWGRVHFGSGKDVVRTYDLYGRTIEIYNDPLPLEIEDLAGVSAQWSKEADRRETFLIARTEYRQYAVPIGENDGVDERELEYTVTEAKWDFLHDFVKRAVLNARQDEINGDSVFIDHYEPADASVWNADAAYQRHWNGYVMDTYLIFWGERIVEVRFSWEPTPEQLAIAAAKLENC